VAVDDLIIAVGKNVETIKTVRKRIWNGFSIFF